jgi:hypothetical protein
MMKKRMQQAEHPESPYPEAKRQKRDGANDDANEGSRVGATELASAFALASLATFSPKSVDMRQPAETREGVVSHTSWEERAPKDEPAPISPETRAPSPYSRRVHFAPGVKEVSRQVTSKYHPFPPRGLPMQASKMPPGFARGAYPPRQLPPPWMRHRMMMPQHGFMPPPMMPQPPMMPPPQHQQQQQYQQQYPQQPQQPSQWICDFCNVASFASYQEACCHEEACRVRCSVPPQRSPMWNPIPPNSYEAPPLRHTMPEREGIVQESDSSVTTAYNQDQSWYRGSTSLSIPNSDAEWLSELNCFIRATCLEAFSATEEDVARTSKRGRITLHQVGIRCRFCAHCSLKDRSVAAVSYPTSVAGIYESIKRWQRVHLQLCGDAPQKVKTKLAQLASTNVWIPTTRQYWADSAKALGMVDTEDGIRFATNPGGLPDTSMIGPSEVSEPVESGETDEASVEEYKEGTKLVDRDHIVYAEDTSMVPPYVYFLMRQVETCHFTEADRFVARSKGPVGYPGFECRHCAGHAGLGKYFPVSSKSLSTNSTSQNIHAHLLKCRKCPIYTKEKLASLKDEKGRTPRLEPGWRKIFFDKVWCRLHGDKEADQS